tara:strand:- start:408 stop:758 length:351 start_codon:yes stop_codon:yes gene_type:complete
MFLATVAAFTGTDENPSSPDKHGKMPVILNVIAGQCPNKRVVAGTIAERNGFITGKAYLFQATEGEPNAEYGRQFNFTAVKEATLMEVVEAGKLLGPAALLDATTEEVKQEIELEA